MSTSSAAVRVLALVVVRAWSSCRRTRTRRRRARGRSARRACSRPCRSPRAAARAPRRALSRLGAKPPSSPTLVALPRDDSSFFRWWNDLDAGAQRVLEPSKPGGDDHELLDVEVVVGVRAAVDDVHQRHRQRDRADAAEVAVQRQVVRRARRRARSPSRPRGSRSRRGSTWSACRRARAARRRPRPGRSRPCRSASAR